MNILRRLRWKMTLSYTLVTVGALLVITLILGGIAFTQVFIPVQYFAPDQMIDAWMNSRMPSGYPTWCQLLSQSPVDTELLNVYMKNAESNINDVSLFRIGALDFRVTTKALIRTLVFDPEEILLATSVPDDPLFGPAVERSFNLRQFPGLEAPFRAAQAGDTTPENLYTELVPKLEARTEGWIAGLQLAALSMQGRSDTTSFIKSFTGSHHFVLDYLIEEVLQQQTDCVQTCLLRTSILDRMCGPLCDAILLDPSASGQETLEYLERANLFIVPLDSERHWYRYHHLSAELLRQRLHQSAPSGNEEGGVAENHIRASVWYEDNGIEIAAFHHAAAANDIERAERLITGGGYPCIHFPRRPPYSTGWIRCRRPYWMPDPGCG